VVAVSAVDANGQHLYFANRGKEVSISAPGMGITAAWAGSDYVGFSGTSAAVPFVSGAIAYLLSENPSMTVGEAVDTLIRYGDDMGAPGKDDQYGNGILDIHRVMERNQKGIYDIAAAGVYVPPYKKDDKQLNIVISAQNRGTELINAVEMKSEVNGVPWKKNFNNVAVGQSISMEVPVDLSKARKDGAIGVSYVVAMDGAVDGNLANNQRKGLIVLEEPQTQN
jgi:subtilisin family serine protease